MQSKSSLPIIHWFLTVRKWTNWWPLLQKLLHLLFSSVPIRNFWNRCEVMQDPEGHLVQSKGLADEGSSGQVEGRRRARARQNPQITRGRSPLCSSLFCSIGCNFTLGVLHIFTALYSCWRKKKINIFQEMHNFCTMLCTMYNAHDHFQ